ncbi:MAG: cation:proton antiporter, partial [Polyangiales bacterium]
AAIVGAFAAGLILDDVHVKPFGKHSTHDLEEIMRPIVAVMAPIFFVRTGMVVDLGGIGVESLVLAAALSAIAVVGKLVAGLGVRGQGIDRWTVGIGMIPRGEVGLIFANVGAGIQVNGAPLMQAGEYAAVVLMVMVTTVISPPWLAGRLRKVMAREGSPGGNPPGDKAAGPQTHSGSAKPSASATGAAASLAPQGPQARVVRASDAPASGALSEQDAPERIEVSGAKMMTDLVAEHEAAVRGDEATQPVAQPAGTPDASAAAPDGAGAATGQSGGGAARASGAASGAPEDAELSDIHAGEATEHSGLRRSERAQAWSAPPEAQSAPPKAQ